MTSKEIASASKIMLGSTEAVRMYIGSTQIWEAQNSLPYDAEIEYLESTGTQYINTGVFANPGEISFKVDCTIENSSGSSVYTTGGLHYIYQGNVGGIRTGGVNNGIPYTLGDRVLITASYDNQNRRTIQIGNSTLTGSAYNASSGEFVLLRILNESNCIGKLYRSKVYINSVLVRDLIPVRVGQTGYMYDKIGGQLYGNNGTGSFTLGPDKPLPLGYTELEYISSTSSGQQYIDLNIKLYETLGTDYDIAIKAKAKALGSGMSQSFLFGCQEDVSPYPGTFLRLQGANSAYVTGRYIGGTNKDNNVAAKNTLFELPVQTSPDKNVKNINNQNKTHSWGTSLFCAFSDSNNTPNRFMEADLYYFKLFVNDTLVRDLIPCKDRNNVVGMYDVINNVFYTSPNGSAFVAGPEV